MASDDGFTQPSHNLVSRSPSNHSIDGSSLSQSLSSGTLLTDEDVASAREQLNAKLPVGRLATEVLCIIFGMLRDDARTTAAEAESDDDDESEAWTAIAQVSRAWRSISLGYAPLWNVLFLGRQASNVGVTTMLSRSKAAPLTVKLYAVDLDSRDYRRAAQSWEYIIREHANRVEVLKIVSDCLPLYLCLLLR